MKARIVPGAGGFASLVAICIVGVTACEPEEQPYAPKPAVSGEKASLPAVPTLPQKPKKEGDAYTVFGATHDLRSRVHFADFNNKKVSIVGYVVKTNYKDAPPCAVHETGKADPPDCKAPVPTFYIADDKAETEVLIPVMGWASNFAHIYDVIQKLETTPKGKESEVKISDAFWGVEVPAPIPNVGAKVKVTGTYGTTFTKGSSGAASNPKHGIITFEKVEFIEPSPEKAELPGMTVRK